MNKSYRLIWNEITGTWIAVAENVKARGKRTSGAVLLAACLPALAQAQAAPAPTALPGGGQVVAGQAAIAQSGANMMVAQTSQRAAIDWQTFNIGSQASVHFQQPNGGVALNRVADPNPSQIFGRLTATGQVFLSNPSGVYFAPSASVDVGGLVATTHRISLDDFMAGRTRFERNGATGSVINEGELKAALGGYIALLAPEVRNQGLILANLGTVALAAGEAFELQFDSNNTLAGLRVDPSTIRALVDNRRAVLAPGGLIILSAQAVDRVQAGVIRNSGRIEATGMQQRGGRIVLDASDRIENSGVVAANAGTDGPAGNISLRASEVVNSGSIEAKGNASAPDGGNLGIVAGSFSQTATGSLNVNGPAQGGRIEIKASGNVDLAGQIASASIGDGQGGEIAVQAAQITLNSAGLDAGGALGGQIRLDASAPAPDTPPAPQPAPMPGKVALNGATQLASRGRRGRGGNITLLGDHLELNDTSTLDARGTSGGGNVLVGGDWQGSGGLHQAITVTLQQGASIDASATQNGNGGKVVLWSDVHSAASITDVQGSVFAKGAGNGVGGQIETSGHTLNVEGSNVNAGPGGLWLLDPYNVTISNGANSGGGGVSTTTGGTWTPNASGSNISNTTINTALGNGQNVVITTTGAGGEAGNITQNSGATISKTAGAAASLTLTADGSITLNDSITSSSGALTVTLNANGGAITGTGSSINTNGGLLTLNAASGTGSISNVIAGSGGLTKSGAGTVELTGLETYTGATTVNGGTLYVSGAGKLYSTLGWNNATTTVNSGATLKFDKWYNQGNLGPVLYSAANLIVNGGILAYTGIGDTAPSSTTDINGGRAFTIGASGATLTNLTSGNTWEITSYGATDVYPLAASSGGALTLSGAGNIKIDKAIPGSGALNVTGSGIYTLTGTNTYTGATTISSGSLIIENNAPTTASSSFGGPGTLTIRPSGNDFTSTFSTSGWNFGSTLGGLTIGKSASSADGTSDAAVTLANAISIAGPITVYGGNIALNNNLTSTASGAAISLNASGNITTANVAKTVSTNNGNISLIGDADANGVGQLDLDYTTYSAGSGNILVRGKTFSWTTGINGPTISSTTGTFTFESSDASFGQGVDTGWFNLPTTLTGLTVGKTTNTQDVSLGIALSVNGPINAYGANIYANASLTSTASGAGILLKGTGNITQAASTAITSNGGDITLWSNSGDGGGYVYLQNSTTLDSRTTTDRNASRISNASGGGSITLGGGSASTTLASGTVVPTGYAWNTGTAVAAGVALGTFGAGSNSNIHLYSGGGNVSLRGKATAGASNTFIGISNYEGLTIDAGTTGNITLQGLATGGVVAAGIDMQSWRTGSATSLLRTTNGSITIIGTGSGASAANLGFQAGAYNSASALTIEATGTGGINMTGSATGTGAVNLGISNTNILAASGAIGITGTGSGTFNTYTPPSGVNAVNVIGYKAGSDVTASTSNVTITDDSFSLAASSGIQVNTAGTLTVQPYGSDFSSAFSTQDLGIASSISGLTIGKSATSADGISDAGVTLANAISIAGPISIYGGAVNVLGNLGSTGTNNLTLAASGNLLLDGSVSVGGLATVNAGGSFVEGMNLGTGAGVTIAANGGFVKTGAGTSYLTGNITTSGTDINIAGPVQIANFNGGLNPLTLASGGGNITLGGAVSAYSGTGQSYAMLMANTLYGSAATAAAVGGSATDVYLSYAAGSGTFWGLTGLSSVNYLVVGGGGGGGTGWGGNYSGGGGGGGGVAVGTYAISGIPLGVTVGAGGGLSSTGGDSSLGAILAGGGGGGGNWNATSGLAGRGGAGYAAGGGGGGAGSNTGAGQVGGTGTQANGGNGLGSGWCTNCGGGGGGSRGNAPSVYGGAGYASSITGSAVNYGVGGNATAGTPVANTGGGGSSQNYGTYQAANGVVIARYTVGNGATSAASALKLSAGSGSVTASGAVSNLSSVEVNAGAASSIAAGMSGTGSTLTNSGAGILTVSGAATYSGLTTVTSSGIVFTNDAAPGTSGFAGAGTITIQPSSSNFTSPFTTNYTYAPTLSGLTLGKDIGATAHTDAITIGSAIGIAGPINIYAGAVTLNAGLTTTNATTGDITIVTSGLTGSGNIALASGRGLSVTQSGDSIYSGAISGTSATFAKSGAGALTLTGTNTYTGATAINAGTLQLGNGGTTGTLATSGVTNNGTLRFYLGVDSTVAYGIGGTGSVEIKGGESLLFNSFLTTTGQTVASNTTVLDVLQRLSGAEENGAAVNSGSPSPAGVYWKRYDAATNTATFQVQMYYNNGAGNQWTKVVFVKLTQSGSNVQAQAYQGDSTGSAYAVYQSGNNLGTDYSTAAYTGAFGLATTSGMAGYGVDQLYGSSKISFTANNTYTGATTLSNTTTSVSSGQAQYSRTALGILDLGGGGTAGNIANTSGVANSGVLIFNRSDDTTFGFNVSGSGNVIKQNTDALAYTGTGSYTGTTFIYSGTLAIGNAGTQGSISGDINNKSALQFNRSDDITYAGLVYGTGSLTKAGSNTVTLTANQTYTGATTISGGSLVLQNNAPSNASSSIGGPGTLTIQPAAADFASTFSTAGWTFGSTLGGLTIGKSATSADGISDAGVTLANAISIAGPISIYGGAVNVLGNLGSTGTNNLTLAASGNLLLDGSVSVGGLATVNAGGSFVEGMNLGTGAGVTIAANGGFVKTGAGTSYLTGNITTSGTDINIAGPVQVANVSGSGNPITLTSNGGNITLGGAVSAYSGTGQSYAMLMANTLYGSAATAVAVGGSATDVYLNYATGSSAFWGLTGLSSVNYLVVGGGGGGGNSSAGAYTGGAGGGGGVANGTASVTSGQSYTVTVGAGGVGAASHTNGGNSSFSAGLILAGGGGAGGNYGVSGGGGGTSGNAGIGGAGYTAGGGGGGAGANIGGTSAGGTGSQRSGGSSGSAGTYPNNVGGGGGGAGGSASNSTGGAGVASSITGASVTYGAGGSIGTAPAANTGAGGTAIYYGSATGNGANGAVIVRYAVGNGATSSASALKLSAGSGSVTASGAVSNLSSVEVNAGSASSIASGMSGTGSTLTNSGAGILTVSGAATYTGLTTVTSSGIVFTNDATPSTSGFAGAGTVTIQPSSNNFTSAFSPSYTYASTLTGLTLGKDAGGAMTDAITLGSGISIAGPINVYAGTIAVGNGLASTGADILLKSSGAIALNGAVNAGTHNLTLDAGGNVTQSVALTAGGLALLGGGNFALTNTGNNVATLAGSTGNVSYRDADALAIGAVGSTTGVSATGTVDIGNQTGNLSLTENLSTTNTPAGAIVLNAGITAAAGTATGGNILVTSGKTVSVGSGGTAKLYSGSSSGSTGLAALVGSGSGRFRYNSDESTTNYTTALAAGLNAIFREAVTLTGSVDNQVVTYGSAVPTLTGNVSGLMNGDAPAYSVSAASYSTSSHIAAGSYAINTASLSALGYTGNVTAGTLTVNKLGITVGGITASNKTYDGTVAAAVDASGASGWLTNDVVTVSGVTGSFGNKNVGTGKTVTLSGATYGGADKNNYTFTSQATTTADIAARHVTLNAATDTKTYDGGTSSSGTVSVGGSGLATGDSLTASQSFASKNVLGTNNSTLAVNAGYVLNDGNSGGNYVVDSTNTAAGSITPKTVTLSAAKIYDGTTTLGAGTVSIATGIAGEALAYTGATASDAHVATVGKYINALTLADASGLASNYALPTLDAAHAAVTISAKALTATASIGGTLSKSYDGTTSASGASVSGTVSGAVAGDTLALDASGITLAYDSAHVTSATQIAATGGAGFTIGSTSHGSQASDYSFSSPTIAATSAAITPATLTATLSNTGVTKTYDGTTGAPAGFTPTWSFAGLASGDTAAALASTGAAYNSKDVTAANKVTVSGLSITGITGGNTSRTSDYVLDAFSKDVAASITPKTVSVSGLVVANKTYDGTNIASVTDWGHVSTGVGSETLTVSGGSASFSNANAGNGKSVTAAGYALSNGTGGGLSSNYQLSGTTATTTADIGKAALTVRVNNDADLYSQADSRSSSNYRGAVYSGFVNGENSGALTGSLTVARTNAGQINAGNYPGVLAGSGFSSNNYAITYVAGDYSIIPANRLLIAVNNLAATYGSTPVYSISSAKYLASDGSTITDLTSAIVANGNNSFTVDGVTFTLSPVGASTSHAGQVVVGGYQLNGGVTAGTSANFSSALMVTGSLSVTQKALSANASGGVSKVYDGTTAMASVSIGLGGVETNDNVTVAGSGAFNSKNVGIGNVGYTVSGIVLGGSDATNYYLTGGTSFSGSNGSITPKTVSLSAAKTYDGSAALGAGTVSVVTGVGSETLSYTGGMANDAHVATANKYINALTLLDAIDGSGGLASNYQLPTLNAANAPVTIMARSVTSNASIGGTLSKVYDGTLLASGASVSGSVTGAAAGDTLLLDTSGLVLAYDSAHVAGASLIRASGSVALNITGTNGSLASDYSFSAPTIADAAASISAKSLTVSAPTISATGKTYDGTTVASGSSLVAGTVSGFVGNDGGSLNTSGVTLAFDNAHAGSRNVVASGSVALNFTGAAAGSGNGSVGNPVAGQASDYSFAAPTIADAAASISAKSLTVSAPTISAAGKTYDGTTVASGSSLVAGTVSGFVGNDGGSLNTSGVTLAFDNAHAGSRNVVASGSVALNFTGAAAGSGNGSAGNPVAGQASDYSFSVSGIAPVGASITPATLTPTLTNTGVTKTYDGTTDAPAGLTPTWSLAGLVSGDTSASLGATGVAYNSKDVLTANKVTVSGLSITAIGGSNNSQAGDYVLSAGSRDVVASITPRTVGLSAAKTYDGTTALGAGTVSVVTGVRSETLSYSGAVASDAEIATPDKFIAAITLADATDGSGGLAANYRTPVLNPANAPVTISAAPVLPPVLPPVVPVLTLPMPNLAPPRIEGIGVPAVGGSGTVIVHMVKLADDQHAGFVMVEIPNDMMATGFSFELPERLVEHKPQNVAVSVGLEDGSPLPAWLHFVESDWRLVATAVPAGGLPLNVVVMIGGQRTIVRVSGYDRAGVRPGR